MYIYVSNILPYHRKTVTSSCLPTQRFQIPPQAHTIYVSSFLPTGTINFSACQDAGTIWGREQNEGGVIITRQRMQSRVLVHVCSVQHEFLIAASYEHSCLSRGLCCGVSCHSSRLYSALDHPPCRGVSYVAPGARGWGLILLSSACACSAGPIWGREEIEGIRYLFQNFHMLLL